MLPVKKSCHHDNLQFSVVSNIMQHYISQQSRNKNKTLNPQIYQIHQTPFNHMLETTERFELIIWLSLFLFKWSPVQYKLYLRFNLLDGSVPADGLVPWGACLYTRILRNLQAPLESKKTVSKSHILLIFPQTPQVTVTVWPSRVMMWAIKVPTSVFNYAASIWPGIRLRNTMGLLLMMHFWWNSYFSRNISHRMSPQRVQIGKITAWYSNGLHFTD